MRCLVSWLQKCLPHPFPVCPSLPFPATQLSHKGQVQEASYEQVVPQPPLHILLPLRGWVLLEGHLICLAKLQSWLIFYTPSAVHELVAGGAGDIRLSSRTKLTTGCLFFLQGEFTAFFDDC